jgi:hypothetical protein
MRVKEMTFIKHYKQMEGKSIEKQAKARTRASRPSINFLQHKTTSLPILKKKNVIQNVNRGAKIAQSA